MKRSLFFIFETALLNSEKSLLTSLRISITIFVSGIFVATLSKASNANIAPRIGEGEPQKSIYFCPANSKFAYGVESNDLSIIESLPGKAHTTFFQPDCKASLAV